MEHPDFFAPKFPLQLVTLNYLGATCRWEELGLPRQWRTLTASLRAVPQILRHLATLHILAKHRKDPELARCCVRNCHFCGFINLEDLEGLNITYYIYIYIYIIIFFVLLSCEVGSTARFCTQGIEWGSEFFPSAIHMIWFLNLRPEAKVEGQRRPTPKRAWWLHGLAAQMRGPWFCDLWRMSISDLGP